MSIDSNGKLAMVTGGYALADFLHLSGPLAIVVADQQAMSDTTREHLDTFWELVDEILNAVLFVLIGLEVVVLTFTMNYLAAGALAHRYPLLATALLHQSFHGRGGPRREPAEDHDLSPTGGDRVRLGRERGRGSGLLRRCGDRAHQLDLRP